MHSSRKKSERRKNKRGEQSGKSENSRVNPYDYGNYLACPSLFVNEKRDAKAHRMRLEFFASSASSKSIPHWGKSQPVKPFPIRDSIHECRVTIRGSRGNNPQF